MKQILVFSPQDIVVFTASKQVCHIDLVAGGIVDVGYPVKNALQAMSPESTLSRVGDEIVRVSDGQKRLICRRSPDPEKCFEWEGTCTVNVQSPATTEGENPRGPALPMNEEKKCVSCRYFCPLYFNIGQCRREISPNSKIFCTNTEAKILVHSTFGCEQHEMNPSPEKDTL